ncbi:hypothetical protein [Intrasporangium sp.]|uniref:ATP-grasp domain-containing protein n=1 Tax=Intrasporangium sp. TaxID=1925024 RepID=UPI00322150C4
MPTFVTVLVEERYRDQAQPAGLVDGLRAAGARVRVLGDAELARADGPAGHAAALASSDVVVARGRSRAVLDGLRTAESRGVPTIDPAAAVTAVRDKGRMGRRLARAGLPVPRTWVGTGPELAGRLAGELTRVAGPPLRGARLIAKPVFGDNATGIRVLETPDTLTGLGPTELVVQELLVTDGLDTDGLDLKLYVIGTRVWAVRKPSPVLANRSRRRPGPVVVTGRLRELALTCGPLFGLTVYGVDCIETAAGPVVIEVNDFPNFTHVSGASRLLARHVLGRVLERTA